MTLRQNAANAIRFLSIDAIEKAKSGHPGAPMGMADIAEVLWRDYMHHNPKNPYWINRDRFILSNGHACMLLYSILHLTGYNLSIQDIKNFRQLNSKTPGHPEYNYPEGVELTTGPLGQGIANAVGFALAEKILSSKFNKVPYNIIDHYTYVFLGDGCIMEGISHESCSLAGNMKLGKLIVFYDNNGISIDGKVKNWLGENVYKRFKAYNWHVIKDIDGHNSISIKNAIKKARKILDKPSLLICNTIIAFGSPNKSNTNLSHGTPLGLKETENTRNFLKWTSEPFLINKEIYEIWDATKIGIKREKKWAKKFSLYKDKYPKLAQELLRRINRILPNNWNEYSNKIILKLKNNKQNIATRKASQNVLELFSPILPELIGGSADLTPSTLTSWSGTIPITNKNFKGNYIHYGVREFGMTAIANGISHYNGFIPYTSTFLIFSEYAQNAIRMAALMNTKHIMVYTHDSIGLGEDGATHQPIEQISHFRLIPNIITWRPCDYMETIIAWKCAVERDGPTILILSRQNLEHQKRDISQIKNIFRGGYILKDCMSHPKLILIATGSEIEIAVQAYFILNKEGIDTRVLSFPSTETFDIQSEEYKEYILPKNIKARIAIEAGIKDLWYKYVGLDGEVIGLETFGKSAPAIDLFKYFKINLEKILEKSRYIINKI